VWGVEEKYAKRIGDVVPGDTLVFALGGEFRSVHKIMSKPFRDDQPLWPEKDGSVFPHRVKISDPLYKGKVSIKDLADSISFMRGKQWSGTLQGANGVFNNRATDADVSLIQSHLHRVNKVGRYIGRRELGKVRGHDRPQARMHLDEEFLRSQLSRLLGEEHLEIDERATSDVNAHVAPDSRVLSAVYSAGAGDFTAVDLHLDDPDANSLLDLLRRMAWMRQNLSAAKQIEGLLLLKDPDPDLLEVATEIPNVSARQYEVRIAFAPSPRTRFKRPNSAA
jgi:hypothetical protein